jgi:hypothetical protein
MVARAAFTPASAAAPCSYNLDFPPAYNSWDRVDPLELFGAETVKGEANPKVHGLMCWLILASSSCRSEALLQYVRALLTIKPMHVKWEHCRLQWHSSLRLIGSRQLYQSIYPVMPASDRRQ